MRSILTQHIIQCNRCWGDEVIDLVRECDSSSWQNWHFLDGQICAWARSWHKTYDWSLQFLCYISATNMICCLSSLKLCRNCQFFCCCFWSEDVSLRREGELFRTTLQQGVRFENRNNILSHESCHPLFVDQQEYKCETAVDTTTLLSLVPQWVFARWEQRLHSKAVECSGEWRWCPNAHCGLLAKSEGSGKDDKFGELD